MTTSRWRKRALKRILDRGHKWLRISKLVVFQIHHKSNSEYIGLCYNASMDYYEEDGKLSLCHREDKPQSYHLKHFNYDSFSWLLTRDEYARRGLFPDTNIDFYVLRFGVDEHDNIDHIVWKHDPSLPQGDFSSTKDKTRTPKAKGRQTECLGS